MLEQLPFLQKLWDKGIDITASVITSVAVTLIALAGWKLKLRLDLKSAEAHQRQQNVIAEEFAQQQRIRDSSERAHRLRAELDQLADAVAKAGVPAELEHAWDQYEDWMRSNQLQMLPGNGAFLARTAPARQHLMHQPANVVGLAKNLSDDIRKTVLPGNQLSKTP